MKAATVALRDQLAMALRGGHTPSAAMSTNEVAGLMPPLVYTLGCPSWCGRPSYLIEDVHLDATTHRVTRRQIGTDIYRHLRAMERQGLCTRVWLDDDRRVFWFWTGPPAEFVDELEIAWSTT